MAARGGRIFVAGLDAQRASPPQHQPRRRFRQQRHSNTTPPPLSSSCRRWSPEDRWVLTSIVPDGRTTTETFLPDKWQKAAAWIEERQGRENIYFHVNPVRRALRKKASKEDVAAVRAFFVDLDPRVGKGFEAERVRALNLLRAYRLKPTVIIDSGGGYQGFWRLQSSDELRIDGNIEKAEELERYNIQLEKEFGADHCHNVDRIMRLPGTLNVPNARKRAKGRQVALAELYEFNDSTYSIEQFTPAAKPLNGTPTTSRTAAPLLPLGEGKPVGTEELQAWAEANGKRWRTSRLR